MTRDFPPSLLILQGMTLPPFALSQALRVHVRLSIVCVSRLFGRCLVGAMLPAVLGCKGITYVGITYEGITYHIFGM